MTLIVEDGTGLPTANAYCSVEYASAYFALRGMQKWDEATPTDQQAAIVQATDYIDVRWGHMLVGRRATAVQALEFPRNLWSVVPEGIKKACAEYAVRALDAPLMPDLARDESGFQVLETDEKVGPIQEKKKYASSNVGIGFQMYPSADALMRPFLGANALGRVIRNG